MNLLNQPDLFSQFLNPDKETGEELAKKGMEQALNHANEVHEDWGLMAFSLGMEYIAQFGTGYQFLAEQLRLFAEAKKLPEPPSKTAWGGIMRKLAMANKIRSVGFKKVNNAKAHGTPATLWEIC